MRPGISIHLSPADRRRLEALVRDRHTAQQLPTAVPFTKRRLPSLGVDSEKASIKSAEVVRRTATTASTGAEEH
jgi:hypothetical protein